MGRFSQDENGYADGDTVAAGEIAEKSVPRLVIEEMGRGLLGIELSPEDSDIAADAAAKYTRGAADSAASVVTSPYSPLNSLTTLFASVMTGSVARGSEVVGAVAAEGVAGALDPALGTDSKAPGDYFYEGGKSSYTALETAIHAASFAMLVGAARRRPPRVDSDFFTSNEFEGEALRRFGGSPGRLPLSSPRPSGVVDVEIDSVTDDALTQIKRVVSSKASFGGDMQNQFRMTVDAAQLSGRSRIRYVIAQEAPQSFIDEILAMPLPEGMELEILRMSARK